MMRVSLMDCETTTIVTAIDERAIDGGEIDSKPKNLEQLANLIRGGAVTISNLLHRGAGHQIAKLTAQFKPTRLARGCAIAETY